MSASPSAERGLTLVELLVALALLALMITLLLAAFQGGRHALNVAERRQAEPSIEAARSILLELLSSARPVSESAKDRSAVFRGDPTHAAFTAAFEKRGQYAGIYRVSIFLSPPDRPNTHSTLTIDLQLHRPRTNETPPPTRHVLLGNVETLKFRYFGQLERQETMRWYDSWAGQHGLPRLISLHIQFASGQRRQFPELIAHPELSQTARHDGR